MKTLTYILATGGTGGHVFPAHALAHELKQQGHRVYLFVDGRYDKYRDESAAQRIYHIWSASPYGGVIKKIQAAFKIGIGVLQALFLVLRLKPDVVVGFGGYPTFPTLFASKLARKKIVLHEQNSVFGRANKFLSKFVDHIATSFPKVKGITKKQEHKVHFVGNPVRQDVITIRDNEYELPKDKDKTVLLITAGSQGAKKFNELIPDAIATLPNDIQDNLEVYQQCREEEMDTTLQAYGKTHAVIELAPFFKNMGELLDKAHLVIGRSGASTVAELSAAGKPAIFIPYPHAMDDHQTKNADAIVDAGGAALIPESKLTAESLGEMLNKILSKPKLLSTMAKAMKNQGKPDATANLYKLVTNPLVLP